MQRHNIHSQSVKYLTEAEMPKSVKTSLSVRDINTFKMFLDANDMDKVLIGYYSKPLNLGLNTASRVHTENCICYAYDVEDDGAMSGMTYMTIKYGSVEEAYNTYKEEIFKLSTGTIDEYSY